MELDTKTKNKLKKLKDEFTLAAREHQDAALDSLWKERSVKKSFSEGEARLANVWVAETQTAADNLVYALANGRVIGMSETLAALGIKVQDIK